MVVRVALDWTANTTHAALLFAESRGFAQEEGGSSLEFVEPNSADAPPTPLDGLLEGTVDVAISPCDHVLKEHMGEDRVVCVATLTAVDISAVCVLESSDITGPAELGKARYGSCGYPLEVACLEGMIEHEAIEEGEGDGKGRTVTAVCPPVRPHTERLLLEGEVDCAWMYRTWECVRAKRMGLKLREFPPGKHGVPFGYMNCVVVTREKLATEQGRLLVRQVLAAASKGAAWAMADTARAAKELKAIAERGMVSAGCGLEDEDVCRESMEMLAELNALVSPSGWGQMDMMRWALFVNWVFSTKAFKALGKLPNGPDCLNISALFTNEYLAPAGQDHNFGDADGEREGRGSGSQAGMPGGEGTDVPQESSPVGKDDGLMPDTKKAKLQKS